VHLSAHTFLRILGSIERSPVFFRVISVEGCDSSLSPGSIFLIQRIAKIFIMIHRLYRQPAFSSSSARRRDPDTVLREVFHPFLFFISLPCLVICSAFLRLDDKGFGVDDVSFSSLPVWRGRQSLLSLFLVLPFERVLPLRLPPHSFLSPFFFVLF